MKELLS